MGEGDLVERRDNTQGSTRYAYDAAHRLTHVLTPQGQVEEYEYDAGDNLVRAPRLSEGALETLRASAPPSLYTLDAGRVAMTSGNRLHRANGARFHYDDRDHVVAREGAHGVTYYLRDSADQLVKIDAPELAWTATYDPLGRRTSKTVNGAATTYHWDDDRLSAEVFPDGRLRVYVYPDALAIVPTMFVDYASTSAEPETGRPYYVVTNHQGATELVLDAQGTAVWRARLDPYGTAHVEVGADFHQPLRWPGHFHDSETGLHYNRFRYYDPTLGRYLESDPLGIAGGANVYAPTANPLRDVDLRGLASKCPNHVDCPDNPANRKKQRVAAESNEAPDGGRDRRRPDLDGMSDAQLRNHCERRAAELQAAMERSNPRAAQHVTLAVGVVQGRDGTRRVVVTTSSDGQTVPRSVRRSMARNGETLRPTSPTLRRRREANPDFDPSRPAHPRDNPRTTSRTVLGTSDVFPRA